MSIGPIGETGSEDEALAKAQLAHEPIVIPKRLGPFSWALYEWGQTPYVILITVYIFGPYFSNVVVGDPERGQALWGYVNGLAGFGIALLGPILGAIADRGGARKPWLFVLLMIEVPVLALLWYAQPDGAGLPLLTISIMIITITIAFEMAIVFHNAMLLTIVPENKLGGLSGLGLALGNAGGLFLLFVMLYAFALPGTVDAGFLPDAPLLGLDPAAFEPQRIAGPLVAIWMVIFAIPLFVFTPDVPRAAHGPCQAVRLGLKSLVNTLSKAAHYRNIMTFLIARMLYADGKTAILIFGGVYATGVFGWTLIDQLAYGIVLSVFAVIGGILGGVIDDWIGSKRATQLTIGATMLGLLAAISMSRTEVFFIPLSDPGTPIWSGPVFKTLPEVVYISVGTILAMSITAAYATSRTLMARLAPPSMMSEFFGLYALSGKATAFLGPFTVGLATALADSTRMGFASVILLLGAGFVVLAFVHEERSVVAG